MVGRKPESAAGGGLIGEKTGPGENKSVSTDGGKPDGEEPETTVSVQEAVKLALKPENDPKYTLEYYFLLNDSIIQQIQCSQTAKEDAKKVTNVYYDVSNYYCNIIIVNTADYRNCNTSNISPFVFTEGKNV